MWLTSRPIAHRALHDEKDCPENSLAAVRKAVAHACPIEIDIQLTRDRALIVFHDEELFRLTGLAGRVRDRDYRELSVCRLLGTDEHIPLFDEVLEAVNGAVPLLIEVKNDGPVGPLERILAGKLDRYRGEYAVQSFNPFVLMWFKKNCRQIVRGQISCFFEEDRINPVIRTVYRMMLLNVLSSPDFIAYDVNRLPYWAVTLARRSGIAVLGWTVRSAAQHEKISPYVDNIIFENFLPLKEG